MKYALLLSAFIFTTSGAAHAQDNRPDTPLRSFSKQTGVNPYRMILDLRVDAMRDLDATCKDNSEATQRQWGMYHQCIENHRQLVEMGKAR